MAPTAPIPIQTPANSNNNGNNGFNGHYRSRSMSMSSQSSGSSSSSPEIATPASSQANLPSPSTSPVMSYLAAQQKSPGAATFPFRRPWPNAVPVFEEDEADEPIVPHGSHLRRASTQVAGRFAAPATPTSPTAATAPGAGNADRGTGLLRRLSLGGSAFIRPSISVDRSNSPPAAPPPSAVSPTGPSPYNTPGRSVARRTTLSVEKPKRAPSPMSERILKGHFDGFN